tara:strand:- start:91 stop:1605 length:1515 start_codon:yes stop_codon:yes gene_type:complete
MVDQIEENTPPDLTSDRASSLSGVIDQLRRTETNTSRRERKQLAAIKQSNEILSFLFDATEANIEVNQEMVEGQYKAELEKKEAEQEAAKKEKLKAQIGLKNLEDGAGKLVKNKGFQAALAATIIGILAIEDVQIFVQEKLVPLIKDFLSFMTTTAIPFLTDNFKEIMVLLGSFVALTLLVNIISRINILLKAVAKVWGAIAGSIALFNSTVFDTKQGIDRATTTLKLSRGAIGALGAAATFLTSVAMPQMIDALGLTGATLVSSAVGLGVALLPLIAINAKAAIIIGVIVGIVSALTFGFTKLRDHLNMNSAFDFVNLALAGLLDAVSAIGNLFLLMAKGIGKTAKFLNKLLGFEDGIIAGLADMELLSMDNTSNALLASQTKKRDNLIKAIQEEDDVEKAKELFAELQRVEKLLEEKGVETPERDFQKLRVEKLAQDEHKLREELKKGTRASELALFQNIYDMSDNSSTSGGGSGGGTTFINGNTSPENQDTELLNAAGSGN